MRKNCLIKICCQMKSHSLIASKILLNFRNLVSCSALTWWQLVTWCWDPRYPTSLMAWWSRTSTQTRSVRWSEPVHHLGDCIDRCSDNFSVWSINISIDYLLKCEKYQSDFVKHLATSNKFLPSSKYSVSRSGVGRIIITFHWDFRTLSYT